jgi:UDP-N-acetylglucosamine 2-epimerase (non-hydrolysing)/GDP/UDP-N,N'-diacetylbacillosamine 2-epimerase (hydrolysing)
LLKDIVTDRALELLLYVTGTHLSPEFGRTVALIEQDGFSIGERVDVILSSDTPEAVAKSMGLGTIGFAQIFAKRRPDCLVVLGDRFEMHAAALAALPFKIPVAHIHGGEATEGAIDDALRHSITKLSHVHFASTEVYRQRIIHLGEEPWRVTVSGALSLDNLARANVFPLEELERRIGRSLRPAPLLVTFHPTTLEYEATEWQVMQLIGALEQIDKPIVITAPNADTGGRTIRQHLAAFVQRSPKAVLVENLGTPAYFGMMTIAAAMVGNSSSGILEAMSFRLPVVNIGTRQDGRVRADNVIDVGYKTADILQGIGRALDLGQRRALDGRTNPYGDGKAASRILSRLKTMTLDDVLIRKRFGSGASVGITTTQGDLSG